uniref:Ubiquitin-conjugating enzyme E2 25-like n=1 Tax=Dermatophagoides pteronyssinus TaxID=6956 RepID=A0A6P6Y0L1_DERPT|nr:ubiquitin-conjugating enzyme E2 25-like [Dermatophagoides pteronyssinus]
MLSLNCFSSSPSSDSSDQSNGASGHHHHHHHQHQHSNNRFSVLQSFCGSIPSQLTVLFVGCFRCCCCLRVCSNKRDKNRKRRFSFNRDRRLSFPTDLQQQQIQHHSPHASKFVNNVAAEKSANVQLSPNITGQEIANFATVPTNNQNGVDENAFIDEAINNDGHDKKSRHNFDFRILNRLFFIEFFRRRQKNHDNDNNRIANVNVIYHNNDDETTPYYPVNHDQQYSVHQSLTLPSSSKQPLILQQLSISSLANNSCKAANSFNCDVILPATTMNPELFESKNSDDKPNEADDNEIDDDGDEDDDDDGDEDIVISNQRVVPSHSGHNQFIQHQSSSSSPSKSLLITSLFKSSKKSVVPSVGSNSNSQRDKQIRMDISTKRLMREIGDLMRRRQNQQLTANFTTELVNDSLYEWYIKIYEFDKESQIYSDMQQYQIQFVQLHVIFPDSYPFEPPFIRVVTPYIERGFVMEGGAICLELLTKTGWTSAYTMESVIIQLMASFVKGQATIKATKDVNKCFTKKSAINSFRHIVRIHDKHGWVDTPLYEG